MKVLYNLAIFMYHILMRCAVPFHKKARLYVLGRKGWQEQLRNKLVSEGHYLWFHCASLGEFEQGRPLIEAIRKEYPRFKIMLTFFSPSGYEVRKKYPLADYVGYLPADTPRNAALFLDILRPEAVFFVKYEFWYNYIAQLKSREIPLYLVSGIFRKEQMFFSRMPWGGWFREMLKSFTRLFVQDEASAALLSSIGISRFTVSGDTRFDRVAAIANSSQPLPVVDKFSEGKPLLVAGSTWKPDEELLVPFLNSRHGWKFILVPHEVNAPNINRLTALLKKPWVLWSQVREEEAKDYEVLVVDKVGLLSSLYKYGTYAYIGGGFGVGIHNILEAATFGLPIFFGPNYRKFREACQLTGMGGAFPVTSTEAFTAQVSRLAGDPDLFNKSREVAKNYVIENCGATRKILSEVFPPVD